MTTPPTGWLPEPEGVGATPSSPSPYGQAAFPPVAPSGPAPYGQAPYGQAPYGQAPYGQAPYGQAPYGPRRSGVLTAAVVVIAVCGGLVLIGVLAAIAIPVFLNQRQAAFRAQFDATTCEELASDTVRLDSEAAGPADPVLTAITDLALLDDARDVVELPPSGQEAFVMSCTGTGAWDDGYSGSVTIELAVDAAQAQFISYRAD